MIRKLYLFACLLFCVPYVFAHGSMETPLSRIYNCYKENPENPKSAACRAAIADGGTGAIYDWNGVNQGAANDRHQELIPDGKLCSGGRELFKGMDLARNDWVTTTIAPNSNNQFQFVYHATAPHATKYFKLYITKPTYNSSTALKWSDLVEQPFCTITSVTLENGRYKLLCPFPTGTGKRVIYTIWQRSDSAEAFYSCNDVVLQGTPLPSMWKQLSSLFAQTTLQPNMIVKFRLFKDGKEVVSISKQVVAGQTASSQWPYQLALALNSQSQLANIGQLDSAGNITPVMSATLNNIYVNDADLSAYTYSIDFLTAGENVEFIYPDGIGSYKAGTIVLGFDKRRYQCKPWPATGWCNQAAEAYEPGRGRAWEQAWNVLT